MAECQTTFIRIAEFAYIKIMPQRTPTVQWHLFMVRIILPTALTGILFLAGIFLLAKTNKKNGAVVFKK